MKKVLFACDGNNYSSAVIRFAEVCNNADPLLLTGIFFNTIDYASLAATTVGIETPAILSLTIDEEKIDIEQSIARFEEDCRKAGIEYRVHNNHNDWNSGNLIMETRFADVLLISGDLFFNDLDDRQPNSAMKEVLRKTECPVLLVPENWQMPEKILIAYDGRKESVFALKEFAHLFPHWCRLPSDIVYISENEQDAIPELPMLEELAARHFANLDITRLEFNGRRYFSTWAQDLPGNALLVTGAFGRSKISMAMKKSFLSGVIEQHRIPIFSGHH